MPKVTVLNCPSCGAPLATDSSRCDFCGARVEISDDRTKVVLAGIACPVCGWENAATRLFCGKCGANLMQNCHNCGEPNPIGLQYCGGCGMELDQARKVTALKLRQEAMESRLNSVTSGVAEYKRLYERMAAPGETVIIFLAGERDEALITVKEYGRTMKTAFVATDRSFMFLERERRGLLGRGDEAVLRKIPFEMVQSLSVDASTEQLVIDFDGGQARVNLRIVADHWARVGARALGGRIIHYIKPFLPLRLQQGW